MVLHMHFFTKKVHLFNTQCLIYNYRDLGMTGARGGIYLVFTPFCIPIAGRGIL